MLCIVYDISGFTVHILVNLKVIPCLIVMEFPVGIKSKVPQQRPSYMEMLDVHTKVLVMKYGETISRYIEDVSSRIMCNNSDYV